MDIRPGVILSAPALTSHGASAVGRSAREGSVRLTINLVSDAYIVRTKQLSHHNEFASESNQLARPRLATHQPSVEK